MLINLPVIWFPGGSDSIESSCNTGGPGSIPGLGRYPEKEMATHSHILAWRIQWTEEPGKLQSTGSQRVGYKQATNIFSFNMYIEFITYMVEI